MLPAWRYTLAVTYAAIERISYPVPIPLLFDTQVFPRITNISEIVGEQSERLSQLDRYTEQSEAVLDASVTVQARIGDIPQCNGTRRSDKEKTTAALEPGTSKLKFASSTSGRGTVENSRICLLEDVRDTLQRSQEDCEDFMRHTRGTSEARRPR